MYFKEDKEDKYSRKYKDQTNKTTWKLNDGVNHSYVLLEQNTLLLSKCSLS